MLFVPLPGDFFLRVIYRAVNFWKHSEPETYLPLHQPTLFNGQRKLQDCNFNSYLNQPERTVDNDSPPQSKNTDYGGVAIAHRQRKPGRGQ